MKYAYLIRVLVPGPERYGFASERGMHPRVAIILNRQRAEQLIRNSRRGALAGCTFQLYRMPLGLYRDGHVWDAPTFMVQSERIAC